MADRWLRWYEGTIRDGKFRIVAENVGEAVATVIGIWASLLEDASVSKPRGTITKSQTWHAMYLQISEELIGTVWNELERLGTLERNDDRIFIINWNKRQFESDHSDPTAQQRKHKWKQRHTVTERNGTLRNGMERSGTPETETETETETEVEVRANARLPRKTRLPKDWWPNEEDIAYARKALSPLPSERVNEEAEKFREWWHGTGGTKLDWSLTWKTWIRRAKENAFRPHEASKSSAEAAGRLAELAERGEFTFGPRPSLLPAEGRDVAKLLSPQRSEQPRNVCGGNSGNPVGVSIRDSESGDGP